MTNYCKDQTTKEGIFYMYIKKTVNFFNFPLINQLKSKEFKEKKVQWSINKLNDAKTSS